MRIRSALIAAFALCLPLAAQAARPTLAVLALTTERPVLAVDEDGRLGLDVADRPTDVLTAELVHQLVASRKFDVLERQRVDDLVKEKKFQESDYASPEEAPKIAKLLGADYFVLGRLDQLELDRERRTIPYTTQTVDEFHGQAALYLRVIDARTGRIVAADRVRQDFKDRKLKTPAEARSRLIADTARVAVVRVMDAVFPLKVVKIDGRSLYLNRGAEVSGLKLGDVVNILRPGEAMTDPDTGESLGQTEQVAATAKVVDIQPRFTRIELDGEATGVSEGMLVRRQDGVPAKSAPAPVPTPTTGPAW